MNFSHIEARDFWSKVDMHGPQKPGVKRRCWVWRAFTSKNGYGMHCFRKRKTYAHIISFLIHRGEIPAGKEIDHKCRTRNCIRPSHLRAITHRENMLCGDTFAAKQAARTHCLNGHPLSGENLYIHDGHRGCLICRRKQSLEYSRKARRDGNSVRRTCSL